MKTIIEMADKNVSKNGCQWKLLLRPTIEVLHQIIRHAVPLHLTSLGHEVGRELGVADPEDGVDFQKCQYKSFKPVYVS